MSWTSNGSLEGLNCMHQHRPEDELPFSGSIVPLASFSSPRAFSYQAMFMWWQHQWKSHILDTVGKRKTSSDDACAVDFWTSDFNRSDNSITLALVVKCIFIWCKKCCCSILEARLVLPTEKRRWRKTRRQFNSSTLEISGNLSRCKFLSAEISVKIVTFSRAGISRWKSWSV